MRNNLIRWLCAFPDFFVHKNYVTYFQCSRASKVFTNHQLAKQSGCMECFAEVGSYI